MYPVYDLTTEGGREALLQHLRGHNVLRGSLFQGLAGVVLNADGSFSFRDGYLGNWQRLFDFVTDGRINPGESLAYESLSTNAQGALEEITDSLPVTGDRVILMWMATRLSEGEISVNYLQDGVSIAIEVKGKNSNGGDLINYTISGKRDSDFFVSPLTCNGHLATYADVCENPKTQMWIPAFCLGPNAERFVCSEKDYSDSLNSLNIENFGVITSHGQGAELGNYFSEFSMYSLRNNQRIIVCGDGGCLTFKSALDLCDIDDWDGNEISIDDCKEAEPDYDWDHPITEPYPEDEPKSLSATKKHFIRVS